MGCPCLQQAEVRAASDGSASWGSSARQGCYLSVALLEEHQRTSGFRCVPSSAQTFCDLPSKSSFSTASVSFTTLGFHKSLRAVGAVVVFLLQSSISVWFSKQHLYCLPPAPPPTPARISLLPKITLHFRCYRQPQRQPTVLPEVVPWWERRKKRGKT